MRRILVLLMLSSAFFRGMTEVDAGAACFFSPDPDHVCEIHVPALALEGPYLRDVNNSGPYIGDIDGDGAPDILVSPWGMPTTHTAEIMRYIEIYYNRGGTFGKRPDRRIRQDSVSNCLVGDFDSDGKPDLASVKAGTFMVYFGCIDLSGGKSEEDLRKGKRGLIDNPYGLGDCGRLEFKEVQLEQPVVCDFLGGARWRRLTTTEGGSEIRMGLFEPVDSEQWVSSAMADMDNDKIMDVVILSEQLKGYENIEGVFDENRIKIRIYYGPFESMSVTPDNTGRYLEMTMPGAEPVVCLSLNALKDMNNDGKRDIVITSGNKTMIVCQKSEGGFPASPEPSVTIANSDRRARVADMNHDGAPDLVLCRDMTDDIAVMLNDGKGGFAVDANEADQVIGFPKAHSIEVADMNNDDWPDIVAVREQAVVVFFNTMGKEDVDRKSEFVSSTSGQNVNPLRRDSVDTGKPSDEALMMPYYTGKVYPTPREVEYLDDYLPMGNVGILVGKARGLTDSVEPAPALSNTPVADVLVDRITRYGGKAMIEREFSDSHDVWVSIGDTDILKEIKDLPEIPEHEQAYVVSMGRFRDKPVVVLNGRGKLGLLWAVTSFGQLVHCENDRTVARKARIVDYPEALNRGPLDAGHFSARHTPAESALYNIYFKLNMPVYKHLAFNYLIIDHPIASWRDPENLDKVARNNIREIGQELTPLGIEWYGGMHPAHCPFEYSLSGAPEDIDIIMEYANLIADAGGNFYIQHDDSRFWMNPYDEKAFGVARRADVYIMNTIVDKLVEKHPNARLMYCPPFYWGPTGGVVPWYGESRDDYLDAFGKYLSDRVDINWTGPRVKSAGAKKEHVEWIIGKTGRKPAFYQNWAGAVFRGLTVPVTIWSDWLYDGFLGDMTIYSLNCPDNIVMATLADYCWNSRTYDPEESIRQAVSKLMGPEAFEKLHEADELLACMDKYQYFVYMCVNNRYKSCPEAAKEIDTLEENVNKAGLIYDSVFESHPASREWLTEFYLVWFFKRFIKETRADKKLELFAEAGKQKERAGKEAGYVPEQHIFLAACDFKDGNLAYATTPLGEKRPASVLSGHKPKAVAEFVVDKTGPSECDMLIVGKTGGEEKGEFSLDEPGTSDPGADLGIGVDEPSDSGNIKIGITLNGKELYNGPSPFGKGEWSRYTVKFGNSMLADTNSVSIAILGETDKFSTKPEVCINYAVIKSSNQ